jgi:hypothetical protein
VTAASPITSHNALEQVAFVQDAELWRGERACSSDSTAQAEGVEARDWRGGEALWSMSVMLCGDVLYVCPREMLGSLEERREAGIRTEVKREWVRDGHGWLHHWTGPERMELLQCSGVL